MQDKYLELVDELTPSDLPSDEMQWIAEEFGMRTALRIIQRLGGLPVYIPKGIITKLKKLYAKRYFTGTNHRRLAMLLDVSERTVRRWVDEDRHKHQQLSLFSEE